jgi:hypothetical protein
MSLLLFYHFLFRLANMAVLAVFFGIIMVKYGLPTLRAGLELYHATLTRLTQASFEGDKKIAELQAMYAAKEHDFEKFKICAQHLTNYRKQQLKYVLEQQEKVSNRMVARTAAVSHANSILQVQKIVVPEVLKNTRAVFEQRYANPATAHAYIAHAINALLKKNPL